MTQQSIEIVIGRLLTDEEFRRNFLRDPRGALWQLLEEGMHMTPSEVAAVVAMESEFWGRVSDEIDPRIQKASLKS